MLQTELEAHLGASNVAVEAFGVAPWAFLSAFPISALCLLLAALLNACTGRFTGLAPGLMSAASVIQLAGVISGQAELLRHGTLSWRLLA